jgi:hypothetical protein
MWGTGEVHTGFWWGGLLERNHLEDSGMDRRIILNWMLKNLVGEVWSGLIWLRIGTSGER